MFTDAENSTINATWTTIKLFKSLKPEDDHRPLVDAVTSNVLNLIRSIILGFICGFFGTVTNIINIFIFVKQGIFSEGSTLNLFSLSLADLGVCFMNMLLSASFLVYRLEITYLPLNPRIVLNLILGWPLKIFIGLNRMLTAYLAFERCMCVVMPFRVKGMFASRRALIYLLSIFVYGFSSHIPFFATNYIGDVKVQGTNITTLGIVHGTDRDIWHGLVFYANNMVLHLLTAFIVVVCTIITISYVRVSKEWRNRVSRAYDDSNNTVGSIDNHATRNGSKSSKLETEATCKAKNTTLSKANFDKEARLVKMITTISIIFCVCYSPDFTMLVMTLADRRFNTGMQYERLAHMMHGFAFLFAAINSSINIFIYYRMSTKYRQIFQSYFCKTKEKK